jgi:ABC-type multidrug transport system fused ATPase/permease subunit
VISLKDLDSRISSGNEKSLTQGEETLITPRVADKFLKDEHRAKFGVPMRVKWLYLRAGGFHWWTAVILFSTAYYLASLNVSWFIKSWGEAYSSTRVHLRKSGNTKAPLLSLEKSRSSLYDDYPSPLDDVRPWLWTYFGVSVAPTIQIGYSITEAIVGLRASKYFFQGVMDSVSHATFRFYDVTAVGQLMNRLTSDISVIDGKSAFHIRRFALFGVGLVVYFAVMASVTPSFLIFCIPLMGIFAWTFLKFFLTSQSLRRLHNVSLSPLFTNFGELHQGIITVRAFHAGLDFQKRIISVVDKFQGMDHFYNSVQSWFMYRIDMITAVSAFGLTVVAVVTGLTPGMTAFMLITVNSFVGSTHGFSRVYGELQMDFISVERVEELLHIEQEKPGMIQPPATWPHFGADIMLDNVTVRYATHLDTILHDISLRIPGGSTVALVGRTGSGKSTLAQALIGVVRPNTGKISIDGVSVDDVDIDTLRQRVTFVAQDPILFSGTIRHNLDPVKKFSDEECATVLERVCSRQKWTLMTKIESGGQNLSQGQRQLIGITRAVLRRSPIVILDEATASIDYETSISIQQILRDEMTESTVIIIAHRIEVVKDADYAIVLEHGRVLRHGPALDMLL